MKAVSITSSLARSTVCFALAVLLAGGAAFGSAELILHVAPDGNDSHSGRFARPTADGRDGPLASLAGARDRLRELRAKTGRLEAPVRVQLADGTYGIAKTLLFEPVDSGTAECPVTYEAAKGARPVISGARVITGWKRAKSGRLWRAEIADVKKGKWYFRQLFVDGTRYVRARRPNVEDYWFNFERVHQPDKEGRATFKRGQIKKWRDLDDVEVMLFRMWDTSRLRIAELDTKKRLLRVALPKGKSWLAHWKPDRRFFLENSIVFLDSPGEWFLDRRKGVLSVYPLKGRALDAAETVAPVVDRLIRFEGRRGKAVRHIRFRGLTFAHSGWTLPAEGYDGHQGDVAAGAAIEGDFVEECAFEECTFTHLGRYALSLRRGCRNNVIRSCEFTDLGGGGILIADKTDPPGKPLQTSGNQIVDCHVHHTGKVWPGSNGIWVGYASYTRIARCHVHDVPCNGISIGWGWSCKPSGAHHNIVEFNHVHHAMMLMGDGGGIYTLNVQPGTVIRNNVVHDVRGYYAGGNGIYMDSSSGRMLVENNIVCRIIHTSVVLGGARTVGSVIRNNIFALGGAERIGGYGSHGRNHVFERNIIYLDREPLFLNWRPDTFRRIDYNVYFSPDRSRPITFLAGMSFKEWQKSGRDVHSVMADPMFKDVANGDFTLCPASPALKLGFKPIDAKPVGPGPTGEWADPWASKRLRELFQLDPRAHRTRRPPDPPPAIAAEWTKRALKIDGRLVEREWKKLPPVVVGSTRRGPGETARASRVKACWDAKHLYLAVECNFAQSGKLRDATGAWGRDDGVEICMEDPAKGGKIIVLRALASGKIECMRGARPHYREEFEKGEKFVSFAAKVSSRGWKAEFAIPFDRLRLEPKEGKKLRFNVAVRRGGEWMVWAPTGGSIWYVDRGGQIVLRKKKERRKRSPRR